MSNPLKEPREDTSGSVRHMREDNEYVRLVVGTPHEPSPPETVLVSQSEIRTRNLIWWFKALGICALALVLTLVFAKWGVPFVFQKVLPFFFSNLKLIPFNNGFIECNGVSLIVGFDSDSTMGSNCFWPSYARHRPCCFLGFVPCLLDPFWSFHVASWHDFRLWSRFRYYHGWNHRWHGSSLLNRPYVS